MRPCRPSRGIFACRTPGVFQTTEDAPRGFHFSNAAPGDGGGVLAVGVLWVREF